jgi:hypothetical protein
VSARPFGVAGHCVSEIQGPFGISNLKSEICNLKSPLGAPAPVSAWPFGVAGHCVSEIQGPFGIGYLKSAICNLKSPLGARARVSARPLAVAGRCISEIWNSPLFDSKPIAAYDFRQSRKRAR